MTQTIKILSLRVSQYWLIGQVALLLFVVRMTMLWMCLPSLLGWLHVIRVSSVKDFQTLKDVAYYTDRLLALFPVNERGNCLPRSLVLYRFAKRYGLPVRFHCGVRWVEKELTGHAWLTLEGEAFLEPNRQWEHFDVTYSFPQPSKADSHTQNRINKHGHMTSCVS